MNNFSIIYQAGIELNTTDIEQNRWLKYREESFPFLPAAGKLASENNHDAVEFLRKHVASARSIADRYALTDDHGKVDRKNEAFYRYIQVKEIITAEIKEIKDPTFIEVSPSAIFGLFTQTRTIKTLQSLFTFLSLPNNNPHKTIDSMISAWEKSLPSGTVIPEVVTSIKTRYGKLDQRRLPFLLKKKNRRSPMLSNSTLA